MNIYYCPGTEFDTEGSLINEAKNLEVVERHSQVSIQQQITTECLLCSRHISRYWGCDYEQSRQKSLPSWGWQVMDIIKQGIANGSMSVSKSKEVRGAGEECREEWIAGMRSENNWEPDHLGLVGHCEDFVFYSECDEKPWWGLGHRELT